MLWRMVDVLHQLRSQKGCRQSCCGRAFMSCSSRLKRGNATEASESGSSLQLLTGIACFRGHQSFTVTTAGPRNLQPHLARRCSGWRQSLSTKCPACCQALLLLCIFVSLAARQGGTWQRCSALESAMLTHEARWRQDLGQGSCSSEGPEQCFRHCASMVAPGTQLHAQAWAWLAAWSCCNDYIATAACVWVEHACARAAWDAHQVVLQWTQHGACSWNAVTCRVPTVGGHNRLVPLWARQSGCLEVSAHLDLCSVHGASRGLQGRTSSTLSALPS